MSACYAHQNEIASGYCANHAHDNLVRGVHNARMDTEWFKARKLELQITDVALGKALGVERSVANKVVNGKVPLNARRADEVAELLEVTPEEVLYRAGITKDAPAAAEADHLPTLAADAGLTVPILSLDLSVSMGPGTLVEDFVEEQPVSFDIALLRSVTRSPFDNMRIIRGIGDSMEPTLRSYDRLLVDTGEKTLSRVHGLYWIDHLGAHGVKRLRAIGSGRVLIMSDNQHVPDYDVDAEEMRIHGRAIWLMRDL